MISVVISAAIASAFSIIIPITAISHSSTSWCPHGLPHSDSRDKTYRFVINGRSGSVHGERPYSPWKIALTVLAVLAIVLLVIALSEGRVDWQGLVVELLLGSH